MSTLSRGLIFRSVWHCRHNGADRRAQLGLGLLEVLLLTILLGGVVLGGIISMRALQQSQQAEAAEQALRRADRAVLTFAAQRNRLPCPDVDGDGREDVLPAGDGCNATAGQKGWLPLVTLGLDGAGTDQGAMPKLLYLVQREAQDLGLADATRHNPPAFDTSTRRYSGVRPLNQIATTDICQGIENARSAAVTASQAQANGRGLAYALVHPGRGDFSGTGEGFEGLNRLTMSAVAVELPERGWTPGVYDDRVWLQTYAGISTALECERLLASSRILGFATEWVDEVGEQKESTRVSAIISSTINGVSVVVAGIKMVLAASGLKNAITHLSAATAALSGAIAGCVFLVSCGLIPVYAAAVAAAVGAIAAYTATISLMAASMASSIVASSLSIAVAVQAGAEIGGDIDLATARAEAEKSYKESVERRKEAELNLTRAIQQRDTEKSPNYNTALANFKNKVSTFAANVTAMNVCDPALGDTNCAPPLSLATYEPQINAIRDAIDNLVAKQLAYNDAEDRYQRALNEDPNYPNNRPPPNTPLPPEALAELEKVRDDLNNQRAVAVAAGDTERVAALDEAIAYLDQRQSQSGTTDTAQRRADLTARINDLQVQISGFQNAITALDVKLEGTSCNPLPANDPKRQWCVERNMLDQQRVQSEALRDSLQQQLDGLGLDLTAARNLRDLALAARNAAQVALDARKAELAASLSAMPYTVCENKVEPGLLGQPDKVTRVCTQRTYNSIANDRDIVREFELNQLPPPPARCQIIFVSYFCYWKEYDVLLNEIYSTRYIWAVANREVQEAEQTLAKARQDESDALATLQALSGTNAGGIPVWSGAGDILRRADAKGGVR